MRDTIIIDSGDFPAGRYKIALQPAIGEGLAAVSETDSTFIPFFQMNEIKNVENEDDKIDPYHKLIKRIFFVGIFLLINRGLNFIYFGWWVYVLAVVVLGYFFLDDCIKAESRKVPFLISFKDGKSLSGIAEWRTFFNLENKIRVAKDSLRKDK